MPSPTATMRPVSADTRLASKSFSRSLMTSEISLVLMPTYQKLLIHDQAPPQLLEPGRDAGIDDVVAKLQSQAAENSRVDVDAQPHIFAQPPRELACDVIAVRGRQLDRRGRDRSHATCRFVAQPLKLRLDVGGLLDAARLDQQHREVRALLVQPTRLGDERLALAGGDRRVAQECRELGVGKQLPNGGQPPRPGLEVAVRLGELEDRLRVALSRGRRHWRPPGWPARSA